MPRNISAGEIPMITRRPLLAAALLATPSIARAQRERPMWQEAVRVSGARLE